MDTGEDLDEETDEADFMRNRQWVFWQIQQEIR